MPLRLLRFPIDRVAGGLSLTTTLARRRLNRIVRPTSGSLLLTTRPTDYFFLVRFRGGGRPAPRAPLNSGARAGTTTSERPVASTNLDYAPLPTLYPTLLAEHVGPWYRERRSPSPTRISDGKLDDGPGNCADLHGGRRAPARLRDARQPGFPADAGRRDAVRRASGVPHLPASQRRGAFVPGAEGAEHGCPRPRAPRRQGLAGSHAPRARTARSPSTSAAKQRSGRRSPADQEDGLIT